MNVSQAKATRGPLHIKIDNTIRPILLSVRSAPGLVFKKFTQTFTHKKSFRIDRQNWNSVTSSKLEFCLFSNKQTYSNQHGWIERVTGRLDTHTPVYIRDVRKYGRELQRG